MTRRDPDDRTDRRLVAAFLAGDERAFDQLVDRHERRVYAICLRYFRDARDAEDATQETFLTVLRRAATYEGSAAFSTWLYRVAMNACHDLARRRARRPRSAAGDVEALADVPDTTDHLAARELGLELERALALLDPATRAAVVLHDVQGLPYADVGARLGLPVGTVKSRIHRGHARLAEAVAHLRDTEPSAPAEPPTTRP